MNTKIKAQMRTRADINKIGKTWPLTESNHEQIKQFHLYLYLINKQGTNNNKSYIK